MKQAILKKPRKIEFQEVNSPIITPDQVLLSVSYNGICGSDIHAFRGEHPFITCPIILGHEVCGIIKKIGSNVKNCQVGDKVVVMPQEYCGHCEACLSGRYNICESLKVLGCQATGGASPEYAVDAKLVKILPEEFPIGLGTLVESAAVGVHAVKRVDIKGLNVVVLGAGTIGNLTAQAAKAFGAKRVLVTDISDERLELAKTCGIEFAINTMKKNLEEEIIKAFRGEKADIFFECVGSAVTTNQAISLSKKGHDIIHVGVFAKMAEINMGVAQEHELRLIGTLMYLAEDYDDTIRLILDKKINPEPLVSKIFDFDDYIEAFDYANESPGLTMKVLVKING